MNTRKPAASVTEYYLHHPEKIDALEPKHKKFFWSQRSWHPVVKMHWLALIQSDGAGVTYYPDGTIGSYEIATRVDKTE